MNWRGYCVARRPTGWRTSRRLCRNATEATPEFLRDYYSNCVWYNLGDAEKQGIRRFQTNIYAKWD